jgi:hypothetical protein
MEISINGKPADIILEKEKNVGEVLSALEQWLAGTGNRLSGLSIDGLETGAAALADSMGRELEDIRNLDIRISSWDELAIEALEALKETCVIYGDTSFDLRPEVRNRWEGSAAATFISTEITDLHDLARLSFGGEGLSARDLGFLVEERLRELEDPAGEITNMEKPVSELIRRMEGLPLDVQTGKDGRAAETIRLFSQMGEKLIRLLQVFKFRGLLIDSYLIDNLPAKEFLNGFSAALGELCTAYGNQDTVLVGDLIDYELAPRLLKLLSALKDFSLKEVRKTL